MTAGSSKLIIPVANRKQTALLVLIGINIVLSAVIAACGLWFPDILTDVCSYICLSDSPEDIISRPWTIFSYAFTNGGLLQITFNMLWLYCFGRLLLMFVSSHTLSVIYLAAAATGAIVYVTLYPLVGGHHSPSMLMGASASVIAVAVAVAFLMPESKLLIPLFGPVKIKWITGIVIILFCIGLTSENAGGNLAHLGGTLAGTFAGALLRYRHIKALDTPRCDEEYRQLADKVRTAGYESLSASEKRRFFELSANRRKS